jgi:hypothetical protein
MKTIKERIIEIIGFNMEPERAELKADEIIQLFQDDLSDSNDWEGEYKYAVEEIKELQSNLKDAEYEIRQLENELLFH